MAKTDPKLTKMDGELGNVNSPDMSENADSNDNLDAKRHDRGYNPVNDAKRQMFSDGVNEFAARYKKGPGPI